MMKKDDVFKTGIYADMQVENLRALDAALAEAHRSATADHLNLQAERRIALMQGADGAALVEIDNKILALQLEIERAEIRREEIGKLHRPNPRHPGKHWRDYIN